MPIFLLALISGVLAGFPPAGPAYRP